MNFRRIWSTLLPLGVAAATVVLVAAAARSPVHPVPPAPDSNQLAEATDTVNHLNAILQKQWADLGVSPAEPADELQVLRRLSLSLHGSIPSLEEIRRFEADTEPQRIERWTLQMVRDRRFANYFAARLARSFVGAEGGQFIVFRRDRFTNWLADQIQEGRPFDEVVREMISQEGLWTGVPATNYITQAVADGNLDQNKLAGRTVRAFLGQRIDCAQCHDHPFADWKQNQFEGLAACFGQVRITGTGVDDSPGQTFKVEDRKTLEEREVDPAVPFGKEWWPADGPYRQRLAAWVTHPDNRRFERALANRVWGLVYGRPWISPVDDLPDPPSADDGPDLLDVLGQDFREHHYDLRRLVFLATACQPYRISSTHPAYETGEQIEAVEDSLAAFPLVRLRPEQMIGAMCQSASIKTIDQNSHLLTRFIRFVREQDFIKEYGDLGEAELEERSGTIPQALLRMNGRFASEVSNASPVSASGRISAMAPSSEAGIETAFLCCLTRRPTAEESAVFLAELNGDEPRRRAEVMEDIFWTLFNSPEFSWNH